MGGPNSEKLFEIIDILEMILDRRGEPKMVARWRNSAPRWSQDDAKIGQVRLYMAILRPLGALC